MSSATFWREDVSFCSGGVSLRGWLYHPSGADVAPGVVMAHGFTAVREMFLDGYGEAFASAGLATLVYDHPGFGASDGSPRQSPAASAQLAGYRNAIRWLTGRGDVDGTRLGIWGTSNSGGHVIVLAGEDLPISAAVAQVPGLGQGGPSPSLATLAAIQQALDAGRVGDTVPAVSATPEGVGLMYEDGAYEWFTRVAGERAPTWRNEVCVATFRELVPVPLEHLAQVRVPLRLIVAPADRLTPPRPALEIASAIPAVDVVEIPGGHFDAYEAQFDTTCGAAVAWFRQHLLYR